MNFSQPLSLAPDYEQQLPPASVQFNIPEGKEIAGWIDHTLLKPEATAAQIRVLCQEAMENHFATVCINPVFVPLACGLLRDAQENVCTVVGFLLGGVLR